MTVRFLLAFAAAAFAVWFPTASRAQQDVAVEVFVSRDDGFAVPASYGRYAAAGFRVVVFEVDGFKTIEAELSEGLPADPDRARAIVEARLRAGGDALQARMQRFGVGIERALTLGVTEYPAIAFGDGTGEAEAIVYGETDLVAATDAFIAYRESSR